ncbi:MULTISPECIES: TRAP transporter substrate-binding protein [unclassified Aureimonas]|uniref:TRAP transporter substrate-binding protein n=1 Tax=unclassified Aureimonas TaxID=2615206 RepID=UPI0006F3B7A5|nr:MULTISPECIES: TRAP transporter substrate-binding protein [unclassified Aureimonas]KQT61862.1 ABC transporter substrate-binding protein [Aureimonas sp. Leaf427]KQT74893.1 ABC transporter substrate-binding protein [Aureimonas sp. Leaf460]
MNTTIPSAGISRRAVLASLAAVPLVAIRTGPANAAEFSYKLATGQSITQPINARLEQACLRIKEASDGRLEIRFFPASQLGSDTDLLTQVRTGGIEFLNLAGSVISTVAPAVAVTNVGFAFSGYEQVWPGIDGALGDVVRQQIEKVGMVAVSKAADNSFRQITSASKEIRSPEDLVGYHIRVPVSPIFTSVFKALGASPTSINFNELYTALQTHLVDGQENGLVAIESGKLFEVQKYVAETNHIWDPFWLLGNRRAFGALPDDLKAVVVREFDRASLEQRADVAALNTSLKTLLTGKGLIFAPVDRAPFRATLATAGYYKEWQAKFGSDVWAALEAVVGTLS